jgi:hypothetical protein
MRLLIAALAMALMTASAYAQASTGLPGGANIGRSASQQPKDATSKPKSDDKAYNAVLRNLPDKQYDPWHGVR